MSGGAVSWRKVNASNSGWPARQVEIFFKKFDIINIKINMEQL